jgi:predicted double-glycine peptidase
LVGISIFGSFYPTVPNQKGEWKIANSTDPSITTNHKIKPLIAFQTDRIVKQQYDYSCGSAALATLVKYYLGENFSEKQVIHGLLQYGDAERIKERRAFSLLDMKKFVNALGYDANGYKGDINDLQQPDYLPCIVPIKIFEYKHFVVVKGFYKGHVFVADPWRGHSSYSLAQFEKLWVENVMFIVSPKNKITSHPLKLKTEDLMFIEEKTQMVLLFKGNFERKPLDIQRTENEIPGVRQYYRP